MLTPQQLEEAKQKYGGASKKTFVPTGSDLQAFLREEQQNQTTLQRVQGVAETRGTRVAEAIRGEGEFQGRSDVGRGVAAASQGFSAIGDVGFEVLPEPARNVLTKVGDKIGQGFNFIVDRLSNTRLFKEAAQSGETGKLEEALAVLSDLGNISGQVAGTAEAAIGLNKAFQAGTTGALKVRNAVADADITNRSTQAVRQALRLDSPDLDLPAQQAKLVETIQKSVIGDKRGINNALDKIARKNSTSQQQLLTELVEEGGLPDLKGTVIDYSDFIKSTEASNTKLSQAINSRVKQLVGDTSTSDFQNTVISRLQSTRAIGGSLDKIQNEVARIFASYQKKYGNKFTPENINEIRVEANKFFDDPVEVDAWRAIGDSARLRLNDLDPQVTEALDQQSRLFRVQSTAKALNRQKVSVNEYVTSLGGFTGSVLAGAGSITALAGGPGGLLVAGIAAKLGGQLFAKALRQKAFSPKTFELIKQSLTRNPDILDDLLKSVNAEDRALIESRLLPPAGESSFVSPAIEIPPRGAVPRGLGDEPSATR